MSSSVQETQGIWETLQAHIVEGHDILVQNQI